MFRKRWARRLVYAIALALVVLGGASSWWNRYSTIREGERKLAALEAELDSKDPNWRWEDLEANREPVPDERNAALLVAKFKVALGETAIGFEGRQYISEQEDGSPTHDRSQINRRLPDDDLVRLECALEGTEAAGKVALAFKDRPTWFQRIYLKPNCLEIVESIDTSTFDLEDWLNLDAEQNSLNGRGSAAIVRCQALINLARSVGKEPNFVSQIFRYSIVNRAVSRTERTIALDSSEVGLLELQTSFLEESHADRFRTNLLIDLAVSDLLFRNLASGQIQFSDLQKVIPELIDAHKLIGDWNYKKWLYHDHAFYLNAVLQGLEVARLPEHHQRKALAALQVVPEERGLILSRVLKPDFIYAHDKDFLSRARLRCAATGLAAERFRLATGRWPKALEEIPKEILAEIPLDPFDGKPLKYVHRTDGVTIYSIGPDDQDNGGLLGEEFHTIDSGSFFPPGRDVGFRLYDVNQRGLPALPPKPPARRDE